MRGSHPGTLLSSRLLHAVASEAQRAQLVLKELEKILFVSASNERHSSGNTGAILEYTDVTGPGSSCNWTHNTVCIPPGEQFVCIVC